MATAASGSTRAGAHDVEPAAVVKKSVKEMGLVPTWTTSLVSANPLPLLAPLLVRTKTKEPVVSSALVSASLARCHAPVFTT